MQVIAVDIGNSTTKITGPVAPATGNGWQCGDDSGIPLEFEILENGQPFTGLDAGGHDSGPGKPVLWSVSSVNQVRADELRQHVSEKNPEHRFLQIHESDVPVESDIRSRSSTGIDRLVAAFAATQLSAPGVPVIVVDAGTAVTIDRVNADGRFAGGVIFPGTVLNLQSLCASTDALPDLSERRFMELAGDLNKDLIGKSTHEAIIRGVVQSQRSAIRGIVDGICAQSETNPVVYATGGGMRDLKPGLPGDWKFVDDLVLRGALAIGLQKAVGNSDAGSSA